MVITDKVKLPSLEELAVDEINISSPLLKASAVYVGKYCDEQCKEYMLCKSEEKDPRKCLKDGKAVTACGFEFFKKLKDSCRLEVEAFAKCIEWNSPSMQFSFCRKAQSLFDECMLNKMGIQKPPLGYFSQIRVHNSDRPVPKPFEYEFTKPTPGLPENYEKKLPAGGSKGYYEI